MFKVFIRIVFIISNTFLLSYASTFLLIYLKIKDPLKNKNIVDERSLAYIVVLIKISMLALSTFTIFFNLIAGVRRDFGYSLLSFFLAPFLISIYQLAKLGTSVEFVTVILIPFWTILIINFMFYRRVVT